MKKNTCQHTLLFLLQRLSKAAVEARRAAKSRIANPLHKFHGENAERWLDFRSLDYVPSSGAVGGAVNGHVTARDGALCPQEAVYGRKDLPQFASPAVPLSSTPSQPHPHQQWRLWDVLKRRRTAPVQSASRQGPQPIKREGVTGMLRTALGLGLVVRIEFWCLAVWRPARQLERVGKVLNAAWENANATFVFNDNRMKWTARWMKGMREAYEAQTNRWRKSTMSETTHTTTASNKGKTHLWTFCKCC